MTMWESDRGRAVKRAALVALGTTVVLALLAFDPTVLPFLFDLDLLAGLAVAGFFMTKAWVSGLRPPRWPLRRRSGG